MTSEKTVVVVVVDAVDVPLSTHIIMILHTHKHTKGRAHTLIHKRSRTHAHVAYAVTPPEAERCVKSIMPSHRALFTPDPSRGDDVLANTHSHAYTRPINCRVLAHWRGRRRRRHVCVRSRCTPSVIISSAYRRRTFAARAYCLPTGSTGPGGPLLEKARRRVRLYAA